MFVHSLLCPNVQESYGISYASSSQISTVFDNILVQQGSLRVARVVEFGLVAEPD